MASDRPWVGVSLMLEGDFLGPAKPLFVAGEVEVLEWSFDVCWPPSTLPTWADELIAAFAANCRLLGHGVHYSPLSAGTDSQQQTWLANLAEEVRRRPIPPPIRTFRIRQHSQLPPIGPASNTVNRGHAVTRSRATSATRGDQQRFPSVWKISLSLFCPRDVEEQGRFIDELLAPVEGFLLLDLHNLYCQAGSTSIAASTNCSRLTPFTACGNSISVAVRGAVRPRTIQLTTVAQSVATLATARCRRSCSSGCPVSSPVVPT